MRQFDVFVFDEPGKNFDCWTPPLTDPALGWFHTSRWNGDLEQLDAEWIIFTHPSIEINRDFLNELAQETEGFPMVDAFAPRVKVDDHFFGGLVIDKSAGFAPIGENEELRYVAAPVPLIGVFSRRIIQRTGFFDLTLPNEFRLMDYALRMAHAGGKMFSVPYLVAKASFSSGDQDKSYLYNQVNGKFIQESSSIAPLWNILYTSLPVSNLVNYSLRHPSSWTRFFNTKTLKTKREKATALSKLTEKYLTSISKKK